MISFLIESLPPRKLHFFWFKDNQYGLYLYYVILGGLAMPTGNRRSYKPKIQTDYYRTGSGICEITSITDKNGLISNLQDTCGDQKRLHHIRKEDYKKDPCIFGLIESSMDGGTVIHCKDGNIFCRGDKCFDSRD